MRITVYLALFVINSLCLAQYCPHNTYTVSGTTTCNCTGVSPSTISNCRSNGAYNVGCNAVSRTVTCFNTDGTRNPQCTSWSADSCNPNLSCSLGKCPISKPKLPSLALAPTLDPFQIATSKIEASCSSTQPFEDWLAARISQSNRALVSTAVPRREEE
jgi:hypothetical protein